MWLWLQNQAKARLVLRIACVILAVHLCLMGLLFLAYGQSSVRSFTVNTQKPLHGQRIIVLPFHKKIPHPASPFSASVFAKASSDKMPGLRQKMGHRSANKRDKRVSNQVKAAIVPKKTAIATHLSTKSKATTPAQAKASSKKVDQVKSATKIKQKPATKKAVAKKAKAVAKKKDEPKKQKTQKVDKVQEKASQVDKAPEPEIKKQLQEIDEKPVPPTPCQKEAENHEPILADAVAEPTVAPADGDALQAQDTVYMHQDEYDMLVMYEQIQAEVARCWCPPPGVAPGTSCTLTFYVDWQGKAGVCTTVKPSTVLMFDMSARVSLKDMVFLRSSYGKEITLTFMQEKEL